MSGRIEKLLLQLVIEQDTVTHYNETGQHLDLMRDAQVKRDNLRKQIAAEYREMLEAMEAILTIEDTVGSESEARARMVDVAHAAIARARGES